MNLYQCEAKAKEIGFDKAKFVAIFPCGPVQCQWIDAYFGMLKVDADGLRDGFLMTKDVDEMFPNVFCSDPYVEDDVESIDSAVQNTETELQSKPRKGPKAGYKAPIKYRGPNGETWTGRGKTPRFIRDSGKDKEEFKV